MLALSARDYQDCRKLPEVSPMWPCGQYCYAIDMAIAVDHMSLAAMAEGLGTCRIVAFYEDK
jgi:nitroreductase